MSEDIAGAKVLDLEISSCKSDEVPKESNQISDFSIESVDKDMTNDLAVVLDACTVQRDSVFQPVLCREDEDGHNLKIDAKNQGFVTPSLPPANFAKPKSKVLIAGKAAAIGTSNKNAVVSKAPAVKIELPYREPVWGGIPSWKYTVEIIKEGVVKEALDLSLKSFYTFGRLESCDFVVEHPSCSRYHAVLQYCNEDSNARRKGFYVYDLGSTHGTFVNKQQIQPRVYCRVRVGFVLKFGGSSKLWIIQGPAEDQEDEIDISLVRKSHQEVHSVQKPVASLGQSSKPALCPSEEVTWGMREDAVEETLDLQVLLEKKKNYEVKDPKKTLRQFFENEGLELAYETDEKLSGRSLVHIARVRLPIETSTADEVIAEGSGPSKKEAVLACATDACRLLQAYESLIKSCSEDQIAKRKRELEANDFYDSDEDTYLDRTGSVEKKRLKRMRMAGKSKAEQDEVETHESLTQKLDRIECDILELQKVLRISDGVTDNLDKDDDLDAYMSSLTEVLDKTAKASAKKRLSRLLMDRDEVRMLVEKTRPALPAFKVSSKNTGKETNRSGVSEASTTSRQYAHKSNSTEDVKAPCSKPTSPERTVSETDQNGRLDPPFVSAVGETSARAAVPRKKKLGPALPGPDDPDYASWIPPQEQTGDGKTHLNAKFGY